ncbi:uncharacterized protein LOC111033857 [Myzus persicae]|uniref:uncharacterized protein LOC111033857 n=1 Tax=Myzus persicae TaxID=13164 RepID=UPI000B9316A1|nr:uncharacterized protein LOC111033857 [Myzus persicae]
MNDRRNGPDARKVYSRSNSDDCNDVNDTVYPFSAIRPLRRIDSDSTESELEDHCYHRRSEKEPPYWIPHHKNGGKGDNSENNSEKNGDESLKSSENGYGGPSEVCDYIAELDFDDDRACVDDKNDDKTDKKDADKKVENEVVGEVANEGNNDGEDNNEVQRHPFIRFLERSNFFIRNVISITFDLPPPTPRN